MQSMATRAPSAVPPGGDIADAALQHPPWRKRLRLSSAGDAVESFLARAGYDRAPWLVVAFGCGIAAWFVLPRMNEWIAAAAAGPIVALAAMAAWRWNPGRAHILAACIALGLAVSAGVGIVWARSALVGAEPIARPLYGEFEGKVLQRIEQPADGRIRLVLATREPGGEKALKIRLNVPLAQDKPGLAEGAVVRVRARLMPPAPPMLPGGYDFARAAWFEGFAATGTSQGDLTVVQPSRKGALLGSLQRRLSAHVRSRLAGSPGTIAAAFASGDRGAIAPADDDAMRDAGLTHLLSVGGLHVSAVIGLTYLVAIRLLALWPWLALRVRLPLVAVGLGGAAGIFYTLVCGADVPTLRSCLGAVLVLIALALGREPLSMRMIATGAVVVLLLWPESLVGPSFQMSFAAVIALVSLLNSGPARAFLAPREESWLGRAGRRALMLLISGLIIELALAPIVLFHFHRSGFYGAMANVFVIPLVEVVTMPAILVALVLDVVGAGAPVWWIVGKTLELVLAIAHFTAAQPGAVKLMPQMSGLTFALFIAGSLWLALWHGRARLLGLVPWGIAAAMLIATPVPDILISGDGHQVGITQNGRLLTLREAKSEFTRENLTQLAGTRGEPITLEQGPGAQCSQDFCALGVKRGGREWQLLMSRSRYSVEERALAAACDRSDIVVSDRWLPQSCHPRWLKVDKDTLAESGGLAIVLDGQHVTRVAENQGDHGWWRTPQPRAARLPRRAAYP